MANELELTEAYRHTMRRLDEAKRITNQGVEYWMAREIMGILGYDAWHNFRNVLAKAEDVMRANREDPSHHVHATVKMMGGGKGSTKEVVDHYLDRLACYFIALNADSSKAQVAAAQAYFVVQTRRMEQEDERQRDARRCELREEASEAFKKLSGSAREAGVRNHMQPVFHDAGYRGMYDMPRRNVLEAKGLQPTDNLLDYAGDLELAANTFRMELTEDVLRRDQIHGERAAIRTHEEVGREVRETMRRSKGTLPEAIPVEPHIKEVRKRISAAKPKQVSGPND